MATFQPLINQFSSPTTSGTTSPLLGTPSIGAGTLGSDQNLPSSTLKTSQVPLGALATQPTPTPPTLTIPSSQTAGTNGGGTIDYTLHNGESIQDYNSRIASARTVQAPAAPTSTASSGLGTGGGAAPTGMSYNTQGQLVPTSSLSTGQPTQTFNTNPYNASAPQYGGLVGSLAGTASQPSAAFTQAQQQAQQALSDLTTSRQNEAQALSLNAQNPIPLEFQQGRGRILQNQYLQQQGAYAQQYAGATAQMGAATGQQQAQQSGLAQAAGLAAPQQAGPTNIPFNPVTSQYGTPAAGSYQGGLQGVGAITGQMNVGQNVTQLNSYLGGAQVVGNNLNDLITQNNINPTGLTYANGAFQFGAQAMSNPAYQKFAGQINDFVASLAPILGVGGSVTDMKTQMSNQIVNSLQSGSTIKDVVSYFLDQAKQKVQGLSSGGGVNVGGQNPGTSGGNTFGSFF